MSAFQFPLSILLLLGLTAVSLLCGILVWPQLSAAWPSIEEKIDQFRRLPPLAQLALMLFVGAFVVFGSTKTNSVDQTSGASGEAESLPLQMAGECPLTHVLEEVRSCTSGEEAASPLTVTPEDIARGWQLWEVRTNCNVSYTMPEGATLATNWWVRGAFEDCSIVRLGDCLIGGGTVQSNNQNNPNNHTMSFPFGTNEYDSVWAFTWGKLRFELGNANTEIVAVGAPMSAVPYRSRLWSAADTNDSRIVTWEDFVLGRASVADYQLPSTNYQLVSAQVELRSTGDFIVRSNEVETVYRRVDPEDWDGDGWRNDDDPNPCCWEEFYDYFEQELPEGANENAYYWVEIRPRWNSDIYFYGDAPSNLDDPSVYGKAGETYRVKLLIGKTYDVESRRPFDVVAKSDERIEVTEIGAGRCEIVWPVEFTVAEGRAPTRRPRLGATWNDGGKSFYVMPDPDWLRGDIVWYGACCNVWGDGTNFTYACNGDCTCTGCTVYGDYLYEGYGLSVNGIPCGCHYVPDHGPFEVMQFSFDKSAAIYEEDYTNRPGVVVHPTPSNVVLRCEVYGGTYGGRLTIALNAAGRSKIARVGGNLLPNNVEIPPDTTRVFETEYTPLEPSGTTNDIVATATYVEDFRNESHTATATLTSVKVELEAVYIAPTNHNQSRHIYGVGEDVRFVVTPALAEVKLKVVKGDTRDINDGEFTTAYDTFGMSFEVDGSAERIYTCPIAATYTPDVTVSYMGVGYRPLMALVEPLEVITRSARRGANIVDPFYEGNRYCWPEGTVGSACLVTENYIGPMHVSFQGIAVSELPCKEEDVVTGCFTNGHHRTHTGGVHGAGAGNGYYVQPGNFWFTDGARMTAPEPNWQPNSTLSWKIPIGWHRKDPGVPDYIHVYIPDYERKNDEKSRPLMIGGRTDMYKQVWHIDEQGTYRTDKFGHWISRSRDCVVILDGRTIQTEHQ